MRIGILCAGDREVAPFLPLIENRKESEKAMVKFHEGTIHGINVVALYSGVCKVNAAIAAQILIDAYRVDAVINAGTAGGMQQGLGILDTVISTEVAYHDVAPELLTEFHPWLASVYFKADEKLLDHSRKAVEKLGLQKSVCWGRMVTGEAFITNEGRDAINARFAPCTVDMETAAVAHVCHANRIPFLAIRSITDDAAHSGEGHFEENCCAASKRACEITAALLAELR
jgi:adenosylhomocysteine nucleosidase